MEENIVIAPNPSEGTFISPAPFKDEGILPPFQSDGILGSSLNYPILIGGLKEGWNGNFLPNEHMTKFLSGQMTQQEVGFLFSDNNGSMGLINLLDGLGIVDIEKVGGFGEYTAYLHALSGVNVDQYDMLTQLGTFWSPAPEVVI